MAHASPPPPISDAQTWDAETGKPLTTLSGHTGTSSGSPTAPTVTRIATGGDDGTAQVWDAATGESLLTLGGHPIGVDQVAFTPDGDRLLTGDGWTGPRDCGTSVRPEAATG